MGSWKYDPTMIAGYSKPADVVLHAVMVGENGAPVRALMTVQPGPHPRFLSLCFKPVSLDGMRMLHPDGSLWEFHDVKPGTGAMCTTCRLSERWTKGEYLRTQAATCPEVVAAKNDQMVAELRGMLDALGPTDEVPVDLEVPGLLPLSTRLALADLDELEAHLGTVDEWMTWRVVHGPAIDVIIKRLRRYLLQGSPLASR